MKRRIFIDVTRTAREKTHTGIQKVVRSIFRSLSREVGVDTEVIPVVIQRSGAYPLRGLAEHPYERGGAGQSRAGPITKHPSKSLSSRLKSRWTESFQPYAARNRATPHVTALRWTVRRAFAARRMLANGIASFRRGQPLRFRPGDVLLLPDSAWSTDPWPVVQRVKRAGGHVVTIWYDVIPITHPQFFSTSLANGFRAYLALSLAHADRIVCISKTVQAEVEQQALANGLAEGADTPKVLHLYPAVSVAKPPNEPRADMAAIFDRRPTLLIVATIEPRKGHALLIDACERLWAGGLDVNLLVIGRVGWQVGELMNRFNRHSERGSRLFLFHDATDADVAYALSRAALMVFPSQAEGLGLPILEAEMSGCPALCSDIPVFREIATAETRFFAPHDVEALTEALARLLGSGELDSVRRKLALRENPDQSSSYARALLDIIDGIGLIEAKGVGQGVPPHREALTS